MGKLITVSGLDGAGKTTLTHALLGELTKADYRAEELEMGPSRVWRWIELLACKDPTLPEHFNGDRIGTALNIERFTFLMDHVRPALQLYDFVIVQRYLPDWLASGRSFGAGAFETQMARAFEQVLPLAPTMIYLDVAPEVADGRIRRRGMSSNPREQLPALKRTAQAYKEVFAEFAGVLQIDGTIATDEQLALIKTALFRT